jgi:MipA family protein
MRMFRTAIAAAVSAAALLAQPALAQERVFAFSLTGGVSVAPSYFGADTFRVGPSGSYSFTALQFGALGLGDALGPRLFAPGTGIRGAFRYIPKREGKAELAGLDDVRASVELGLGLHHTTEHWQVYGEMRYGVIGHRALAGEIGANAIWRGQGGLVLHAGPRAEFGNARFMRTYFGVTPAEAARLDSLPAFRPGRGAYSVGFEIGASQPLSADWAITASLRYDRLRGDAVRSPIVRQGSRDQVTARLGLTRHFTLRF